jgi:RNA-binding protein 25
LAFAKDTLQELLEAFRKNPTEGAEGHEDDTVEYNPDGTKKYKIPAHLQDLGPDDLPEESRGLITSEIALFRERAAKREEQKKLAEANRQRSRYHDDDMRRNMRQQQPEPSSHPSPRLDQGSRGWGNNNGAPQQQQQQARQWGNQQSPPRGPASHGPEGHHNNNNRPISGFVASSSNPPPQSHQQQHHNAMSDEDAERMRLQRAREEKEREYRSRLARWETRERGKLQSLEKEKQVKYHEQQDIDRRRQRMLEKCASFDDDEEAEHGDELFIVDR